ncbi:MAG: VWA domain-containing protein [Planctomycetota bacterium]|nr:MAG: VWA domain-containing protein [Planctomycetota bacterium]
MKKDVFSLLIISLAMFLPGSYVWGKSFQQIKREFYRDYSSPDYAKRMEAVQKVAESGRIEGLKLLVRIVLVKEPDQYVYEETLRFIKKNFTSKEAMEYLNSQLAHGNWKSQLGLCRLALMSLNPELEPGLIKALDSSKWQVRSAAIRALRVMKSQKAIPFLQKRAKKEKVGRIQGEIQEALQYIMGSGRNEAEPTGKISLKTVLRKGGFYGTIYSTRVTFILDISGSMLEGTEAGKRIDVAKRELIKAIDRLPKKAKFNIIAYNNKVYPWKRRMVPASKSHRKSAARWISRLSLDPNGMTATYDALEYVFKNDKEADTIYLLSDGMPTTGKYTGQHKILEEVKKLNRYRNLVIHTIAFLAGGSPGEDKQSAADFMKDLAKDNGGKFKHIE